MISSTSLAAFSSVNTTRPVQQPGPVRLVRDTAGAAQKPLLGGAGVPGGALGSGSVAPSGNTPRGSLLNLQV